MQEDRPSGSLLFAVPELTCGGDVSRYLAENLRHGSIAVLWVSLVLASWLIGVDPARRLQLDLQGNHRHLHQLFAEVSKPSCNLCCAFAALCCAVYRTARPPARWDD
jgi:hypothetical protein